MSSNNPDQSALSAKTAYVGGAMIFVGVLLALLLPLLPQTVNNGSFLLFIASGIPSVAGFMTLTSNIRKATRLVRYGTISVAILIMTFLAVCLVLAVGGWSDTVRLLGLEFGVVVAEVIFFMFAGGIDDILNAIGSWKHGLMTVAWLGNIVAMAVTVLWWAHGHLMESDSILTSAFLVSYSALACTKYISLSITSSYGDRKAKVLLGAFVIIPIMLGWLYLSVLNGLLPGPRWLLNACLYSSAVEFGVSYGIDAVLRDRASLPWFEFSVTVLMQMVFMLGVGIVGAFLPSSSSLFIGLLCMETLPNVPIALAFVSELFKPGRPVGPLRWYGAAFGTMLCVLMVLCALAIFFQSYATLAAGITICLLQATPWMRVAQRACLEWTNRPGRALFTLITVLIGVGALSIFLALWIATKGGSEADLTAIWYSVARLPSAVSLGCFGLLGVGLVGARAPREWLYLMVVSVTAVVVGFVWFILALFTGGVGAITAPGLLMQVAGGVLVTLVYTAFNSSRFREMANTALATMPTSGNP